MDGYTESNGHPGAHGRYNNVEWYAQDTWKVTKNLTLDLGVRFYFIQPTLSPGDTLAAFDLPLTTLPQQPPLIQPLHHPERSTCGPRSGYRSDRSGGEDWNVFIWRRNAVSGHD